MIGVLGIAPAFGFVRFPWERFTQPPASADMRRERRGGRSGRFGALIPAILGMAWRGGGEHRGTLAAPGNDGLDYPVPVMSKHPYLLVSDITYYL